MYGSGRDVTSAASTGHRLTQTKYAQTAPLGSFCLYTKLKTTEQLLGIIGERHRKLLGGCFSMTEI